MSSLSAAQLTNPEEKPIKERSQKMLLWLAMISMVMVFGALSSAYIVKQGDGDWVVFELPAAFYYSTAVLLLSSFFISKAVTAAKNDNYSQVKIFSISTLVAGLTFVFLQFEAWGELVEMGVYFTGSNSSSGSYLYFLTGLHLAHLFAGVITLLVVVFNSFRHKYHRDNAHGITMAATFWHFLDILWVYLFLFLLFIR